MSESDDREDVILRALQECIQENGDSTRRIARFLSVHGRVIEEWLSGVRRPRRATLERIETFLTAHRHHRHSPPVRAEGPWTPFQYAVRTDGFGAPRMQG
ncbi:MAG: hypothetical protein JO015_16665 [Verrucomicrobia bacterium]|nr:hypothetical protein [Verrucomicrobiota bacterium]